MLKGRKGDLGPHVASLKAGVLQPAETPQRFCLAGSAVLSSGVSHQQVTRRNGKEGKKNQPSETKNLKSLTQVHQPS